MPRNRLLLAALLGLATACSKAPPAPQQAAAIAGIESTAPAAEIEITRRVTDAAEILTLDEEAALDSRLVALESVKGHQFAIVTLPSLGGADIADVARDLGNRAGIGRAKYDDGVVLLVAPNERQVRIAVGYGLESRLTDAVSQEIIDKDMLPHFREGRLHAGISAGTDAIIRKLTAPPEAVLPPKADAAAAAAPTPIPSKDIAHAG